MPHLPRKHRISDELRRASIEYELLGGGGRESLCCEMCKEISDGVVSVPRQTMYAWDGEGLDPNRDMQLCFECGIEVSEQIESQWDDYYSSIW